MRKAGKVLAVAIGACMCVGSAGMLAGCGDNTPEGFTGITFVYEADMYANPTFYELVKTYNDTQGQTDKVKVNPTQVSGVGTTRTTYEGTCEYNVAMTDEAVFKDIAMDGLFVNLNEYVKNDNYDLSDFTTGALNSARLTIGGEKYIAGEGQDLQALPFGCAPAVIYYNKNHFTSQKINIVSCAEENLKTEYPNLQPHGYAEYAKKPFDTAVSSTNLAGETVYKVFNNRIPMNWEEKRYLSKMFTSAYDNEYSTSPCKYGYVSEWWFSYGWSVGGDVIGWDGEKYKFTLMDDSDNYLAVEDVLVNGKKYRAGEIVSYEDKTKQSDIANLNGLYVLPSQYDSQLEFLRSCVAATGDNSTVEEGVTGYGVCPPDLEKVGNFTSGTVAMTCLPMGEFTRFSRNMRTGFDVAPEQQYREYEGGSVYYNGEKSFANEYLKVIGKKYDGESASDAGTEYTGRVKTHDGTPTGTKIVGRQRNSSGFSYLVIPKNSDPQKYDASWKFISWACGAEGQKILAKTNRFAPVRKSVALNDYPALSNDYNFSAFAQAAVNGDIGDWAYFENGEWVNRWSGDYNDKVRKGTMTVSKFLAANEKRASEDVAKTAIIINGR